MLTSQTGGSVSQSPGPPFPWPYSSGSSGYGGAANGGTSSSATGAITTTWTWQPSFVGDVAPQSVVIAESCSASASATGSNPNATADNGIGGTVTNTTGTYQGSTPSVSSSASSTRYYVKNGGDTVTITCSPSAVSSGGFGYARVIYSISIDPVQIGLVGPTQMQDGLHILTGQGITAYFSTSYPITDEPNWGITNAQICFGTYIVSPGIVGPPVTIQPFGQVVALDLQVETPSFYTRAAGTVRVSRTATILFPDGTSGSVSAKSAQVQSEKPTASWEILSGVVRLYGNDTSFGLNGLVDSTDRTAGQQWNAQVNLPSNFSNAGGECAFAQIVKSVNIVLDTTLAAPNDHIVISMTEPSLDNGFPNSNGLFPTGQLFHGRDSPSIGLQNITQVTISESFETWLMYRPPGGVWVPIQHYTWSWSGSASYDSSTGTWSGRGPRVDDATGKDTDDHPEWSRIYSNGP